MKILIVTDIYEPSIGGVETAFSLLAKNFLKRGYNVRVITSKLPGTNSTEIRSGVNVFRVIVPRSYGRYFFTLTGLIKILKVGRDVDIIQTTTYASAFPSFIAAKLLRKPCVITVHEVFGKKWKTLLKGKWLSSLAVRLLEKILITIPYDKIIVHSYFTRDRLISFGVPADRVEVVYDAIDYDLFNPKKADGKQIRKKFKMNKNFVFGYYGRPGYTKGVEYFVQAIPMILKMVKKAKFFLILDKNPYNRYVNLMKMIKDLGVEDKVIIIDPVERNVQPNYVDAMDCVVIPSLSEGFGIAAGEACAMRKPVISTTAGALPEVISGKYIFVEPENPKAIANACEKIYKKKYKKTKLKLFTIDKKVEGYLRVYKNLLR